jgi:hypothetical protein
MTLWKKGAYSQIWSSRTNGKARSRGANLKLSKPRYRRLHLLKEGKLEKFGKSDPSGVNGNILVGILTFLRLYVYVYI